MESIYTQAVLDAKAVRASAMANAKAAIQEAFEPKIKAMLKKHIVESEEDEMDEAEHIVHTKKSVRAGKAGFKHAPAPKDAIEDLEEYDEMDESEEDEMDEAFGNQQGDGTAKEEDPGNLDEKYLDEILDELESMDEADQDESDEEESEEEMDEAKELDEAEEMDEAKDEDDETEEDESDEDGEEAPESEEDTKVVDVTLGDLVNAIKAAMAGHEGGEGAEAGDDEVSLDEILAELEDEGEEEDEMDEAKKKDKERIVKTGRAATKAAEKETAYNKELDEAKKAIKLMQKELNEINLLNAKLLYVNKIFKSKSLTEAQKVKVLNAFDRATSVKEVKNTFKFISESITAAPKKQLKESFSGFASKPTGGAPKGNTLESDPFIARMQKLAGI